MLLKVHSASVLGVNAEMVDVEVDLSVSPRPFYHVVGLPDAAIKESGKRVRAAIRNCGYDFPVTGNITVNLAPADFKKEGSCYDLPIALAILGLNGSFAPENIQEWLTLGELSLDGRVRPIRGALPIALSARKHRFTKLLLPSDNVYEAAVVEGLEIYSARSLPQVLHLLNGGRENSVPVSVEPARLAARRPATDWDLADVKGQENAKRALEVACAGGHNLLMIGPPGSGKTMLAKRIASILPRMTLGEGLETTAVHSVCGLLGNGDHYLAQRPFRAPHHTISSAGLVGGGSLPKPGEVSLAHHGVLFLDELPEFQRSVLEVLRQPLEDQEITISRAARTLTFPAKFMLVGAMNPCPCGYLNSIIKECSCTPAQVHRYLSKISGPLMDRIDLHVDVPEVKYAELLAEPKGEASKGVAQRVQRARTVQEERFKREGLLSNSQMGTRQIRRYCRPDGKGKEILESAIQELGFSARAYDRILKVSRTIADLEGCNNLQASHIAEAIQYRSLDRNFWEVY